MRFRGTLLVFAAAVPLATATYTDLVLTADVAQAQPAQPPPTSSPTAAPAQPPAAQPPAAQPPAAQPPAGQPPAEPPQDQPLLPPGPPANPPATPPPATPPTKVADKDAAAKPADGKAAATKPPAPKGDGTESDTRVFAEEWWAKARPVFEFHGYFRVRSELFSHFALGRKDTADSVLWPQPPDNHFVDAGNAVNEVRLCGDDPTKPEPCENNVQAGANMRFRINPELHISDNVRIMAQIDLLDNVVLGSTPAGFANIPAAEGGYETVPHGGYTPTGAFASTVWAPASGVNSLSDSIVVKRVWGEYMSPIGLIRFGRMPSHWGLGMLANAGEGYDSDYGSTADRLMFITGIKKWDLYFGAFWDFTNEGPTSSLATELQGQPYDLAQSDDVDQYGLVIVRRRNPELQKLELAQGDVVVNGGFYGVYRRQSLDAPDASLNTPSNGIAPSFIRRQAEAFIPDLWFQFLYKKFRFEAEAALIAGSIENTSPTTNATNFVNPTNSDDNGWGLLQFGITAQSEIRAVEDKLRVQLGFGYATGDPDVEGLSPPARGIDPQLTRDRTFSTFRFHPDYRVDYILFRNILNRVQGAYYFRPSVEYDFTRDENGQRIGGGGAIVWSRAAQFVQTPGNQRDLGIELDFQLYYQAKDGSLNDDLDKMGGFYTAIQYGVMFPLGGLDYLPREKQKFEDANNPVDTSTAQIVRWYLGIMF